MNGKAVLISGCSSGIGRCAAEILKARGYRVFASARLHKDVDRLKAEGYEAVWLDLRDSDSIRSAVAQVLDATEGRLYGLFNNAAYGQPGAVEDLSREVLREQFETNLFGTHELTNCVIPVMRAQGEGRIVQNSSVLGFVAMPYRGAYNASKYALEGLTDTLRLELKGSGVHVSLIEPGPILSRFRENAHAAYKKNIEPENSVHRATYQAMEARLVKQGPAAPFTLGPEAVVKRLIHALEAGRPRARYYVTFPTYLFGTLKRLLPDSVLDRMLGRIN
ncbi:SDR family oxidoreductase [Methylococcus sp. EFPC2]|uniref:SDR family oxidoreductase n=1 Tax=Methylococcus sp. EFPC2 TaxID=2812648 RepID=UPI0019686587|nr:SDR family oxidoreductase [Methylococcus sp. EFPC2]QSA97001.1 SDR family oxidoreductase [Methylococcus sp. EFPC2]